MPHTRFEILVMNSISATGLARLPAERYHVAREARSPDAILLRSADLHAYAIPGSVRAIGRAGAGVNNIPVKKMSSLGVPVFNAPGANANAVKELVLTGILLAARNVAQALAFVASLDPTAADYERQVEDGKKPFAGAELPGKTLGVIGLGRVGNLVADAAIKLGLRVIGYDPEITVEAAWSLPSQVGRAGSIDEVLRASDFVTLHVPLIEATRGLIDDRAIGQMKPNATLLNFSREAVVDNDAVKEALGSGRLHAYVTDFPSPHLAGVAGVIATPHLGASTQEAEDNSAVMVADQVRDFLEHGNVRNAVNFPDAVMPREAPYRIAIANANVPNMLGQISTALARSGLNIHNMLNKSRGEMAYTLVDVDSAVPAEVVESIRSIPGVLAVRYLPATH